MRTIFLSGEECVLLFRKRIVLNGIVNLETPLNRNCGLGS